MNWAEAIIKTLKDWDTSMIVYVPDISIHQVTSLIEKDPFFRLVPATREEEAIGIAVGSYAAGRNAAVCVQSSGLGSSANGRRRRVAGSCGAASCGAGSRHAGSSGSRGTGPGRPAAATGEGESSPKPACRAGASRSACDSGTRTERPVQAYGFARPISGG